MTTLSDLKTEANKDPTENPYRVSVLYGDYGKRKTTTACSMVNERGLLISADASWKVLLNDRHRDIKDKIKVIEYQGLSQLEYVDYDGYDTIIWDPISTSAAKYLDLLYDKADWGGKYREKLNSNHPDLKGLQLLAPIDYRSTRDSFRPVLDNFFKLPAHIIFTSHATDPIPGLSKDTTKKPHIPSATFQILGERSDLIANLRPEGRNFVADLTENSVAFLAKSRIEGLQGKMQLEDFVKTYKEIVFA